LSDDRTAPDLDHVWAALERQGYALTTDEAIGLPEKFRENFRQTYFNSSRLRCDPGDRPADRQRARDVIRYQWRDEVLHVHEHGTITITDRSGIAGKRDHSRIRLLDDPHAEELVRALLGLVPPAQRQADGTFGVNLFRTFTKVVTCPHHDKEQFCLSYMLNRVGGGAETYLYQAGDVTDQGEPTAEPVLRHQLNPGEIIIFDDRRFKHGATPLEDPSDGTAERDAVVCTVDYPDTYLDASAVG
jgi:hypothetical protein